VDGAAAAAPLAVPAASGVSNPADQGSAGMNQLEALLRQLLAAAAKDQGLWQTLEQGLKETTTSSA
jgi:hypothetical protein